MIDSALREGWSLDAERITCPCAFRNDWLPHADWVELDGIGHAPQLDIPLEAAQLILGFTPS